MVSLQCFYIESTMVLFNKQRFVFRVSGLASFLKNSFKSFLNEVWELFEAHIVVRAEIFGV